MSEYLTPINLPIQVLTHILLNKCFNNMSSHKLEQWVPNSLQSWDHCKSFEDRATVATVLCLPGEKGLFFYTCLGLAQILQQVGVGGWPPLQASLCLRTAPWQNCDPHLVFGPLRGKEQVSADWGIVLPQFGNILNYRFSFLYLVLLAILEIALVQKGNISSN